MKKEEYPRLKKQLQEIQSRYKEGRWLKPPP